MSSVFMPETVNPWEGLVPKTDHFWQLPGYSVLRVDGPAVDVVIVRFPLWLPIAVVALPVAFLFWQDRRRIPPGHCSNCGYKLTGNVSGRCPECGTAMECGMRNDGR